MSKDIIDELLDDMERKSPDTFMFLPIGKIADAIISVLDIPADKRQAVHTGLALRIARRATRQR